LDKNQKGVTAQTSIPSPANLNIPGVKLNQNEKMAVKNILANFLIILIFCHPLTAFIFRNITHFILYSNQWLSGPKPPVFQKYRLILLLLAWNLR